MPKIDKRIGANKQVKAQWESTYKPGQTVLALHYKQYVKAILLRQKVSPLGAWICKKLIYGKWTKESIVNEFYENSIKPYNRNDIH